MNQDPVLSHIWDKTGAGTATETSVPQAPLQETMNPSRQHWLLSSRCAEISSQ